MNVSIPKNVYTKSPFNILPLDLYHFIILATDFTHSRSLVFFGAAVMWFCFVLCVSVYFFQLSRKICSVFAFIA